MNNTNNCTNIANEMNEEERKSEFVKSINFICKLLKDADANTNKDATNPAPDFTMPQASETTKSRIQNITTELQDELEVQRLEFVNKSTGVDLEVLQHAIQRMQDDIKKKQEEEKEDRRI